MPVSVEGVTERKFVDDRDFSSQENEAENMQDLIVKEFHKLEKEKGIRILYAVESGSRAWGFASRDSDWDVRFIYIHHPDWYLQIGKVRDNMVEITPDNIDFVGWDFKKTLQLFRKSNPPLLEWLRSPIVYHQYSPAVERMRELSRIYFNRKTCLNHYYNIAASSFEQYLSNGKMKIKKFFYVIRPLLACSWILERNMPVPVEFRVLLQEQVKDKAIKDRILDLMEIKAAGNEQDHIEQNTHLHEYLLDMLKDYKEKLGSFPDTKPPDPEPLNKLFREVIFGKSWTI